MIEEEEEWSELAAGDVLTQHLREFLDENGREVVEKLPDGIHSGLEKKHAHGVFFYFQAKTDEGTQHFWRYLDLHEEEILDNRHVIASLIACQPDTSRVVDPMLWGRIFELQEVVIDDILRSLQQQASLEAAPRVIDPLQQTVATTLQTAASRPGVDRRQVLQAMRFLMQPMVGAEVKDLRTAFRSWQRHRDLAILLAVVELMREQRGGLEGEEPDAETGASESGGETLQRDQLHLICFDLVKGG